MIQYEWDFSVVWRNFDVLVAGLYGSLTVTGISLVLGLLIGLVSAPLKMSKHRFLSLPADSYIALFRNTPPLVQLFWFFFAFPIVIGVEFSPLQAAVFTFSLQSGAFFAEIFRGGIQSIERGQWDAGKALGMNYLTLMRRIILPQAVKRMIPALTNRGIELTKMTALASTISFGELLYEGRLLSSVHFRPIETFTVVAAIYFFILTPATLLVSQLERRLRVSD